MFNIFRKKSEPTPAGVAGAPSRNVPSKGRVLIVDDDAVVRKALGMKLGATGYEILFAADGPEAVTVARNEKPDIILLDINFPPEPGIAWDGFKLLRWLHRSAESAQTPIIIITGEDPPDYRAKAIEAGAAGFFQKPVDIPAMIALVNELISTARAKSSQLHSDHPGDAEI